MTDTHFDTRIMARALQLARRGRYSAMPNPHVGCVLVRDGHIIGEGFTQPAGGNHAEIEALAAAGDARGATAYVTLEPCSHQGKTGPCADALLAAGVSRVVAALEDPNPQVAGRGLARLREAGIEVSCGLLGAEAEKVIPGFIARCAADAVGCGPSWPCPWTAAPLWLPAKASGLPAPRRARMCSGCGP